MKNYKLEKFANFFQNTFRVTSSPNTLTWPFIGISYLEFKNRIPNQLLLVVERYHCEVLGTYHRD